MAAVGLGGGEEHRQSSTGDKRGNPRRLGDVLADPKPAQDQGKDQLGDEEGLDHRELAGVKCDRLKSKSPCCGGPTQQPEGLTDQEGDQSPIAVLVGYPDAGRVLCHEVYRIGQGGGQSENDRDGHVMTSDWAIRRSSTSSSFASIRTAVTMSTRLLAPEATGDDAGFGAQPRTMETMVVRSWRSPRLSLEAFEVVAPRDHRVIWWRKRRRRPGWRHDGQRGDRRTSRLRDLSHWHSDWPPGWPPSARPHRGQKYPDQSCRAQPRRSR